jgi:hypothetical protein
MKQISRFVLLLSLLAVLSAAAAEAAKVRVAHRGHHTRVTVRAGFPLRRALPNVHVRAPRVAVRVAPRAYLAPLTFRPLVVAVPVPDRQRWHGEEELDGDEGWTDLTMSVDESGRELVLRVDDGPARISFVEVVFENGDTQVVDFADGTHRQGVYRVLELEQHRRVDHLRLVARAKGDEATLSFHLLS